MTDERNFTAFAAPGVNIQLTHPEPSPPQHAIQLAQSQHDQNSNDLEVHPPSLRAGVVNLLASESRSSTTYLFQPLSTPAVLN